MDDAKSYSPEVRTGNDPKFYGNMLRFPTYEEAVAYAADLMNRWLLVVEHRAIASDDPPNYNWSKETNSAIPIKKRE